MLRGAARARSAVMARYKMLSSASVTLATFGIVPVEIIEKSNAIVHGEDDSRDAD